MCSSSNIIGTVCTKEEQLFDIVERTVIKFHQHFKGNEQTTKMLKDNIEITLQPKHTIFFKESKQSKALSTDRIAAIHLIYQQ